MKIINRFSDLVFVLCTGNYNYHFHIRKCCRVSGLVLETAENFFVKKEANIRINTMMDIIKMKYFCYLWN